MDTRFISRLSTACCLCILLAATLTGCHTNYSPEEDEDGYYTIILYGSGGGTADLEIIDHFIEILKHGSGRRAKVVAQINFSKDIQNADTTIAGTHRVVFDKSITIETPRPASQGTEDVAGYISDVWEEAVSKGGFSTHEKVNGATPIALYDPDNITDFLDWAASVRPSEQYVIITWNFHNGWNARDEQTKGLAYDDNFTDKDGNPQCISLDELYYGVLNSTIYSDISTIIADSRYTNSLENLVILSGICDYAVVSCGRIPNCGGWYDSIMNLFSTVVPDEPTILETGLRHYCENTIYRFQSEKLSNGYDDITLWKFDSMPDIMSTMSDFVELLCDDYPNDRESYNRVISDLLIFDTRTDDNGNLSYPLASFDGFLYAISEGDFNEEVVDEAKELLDLIKDSCTTVTGSSVTEDAMLSTAITFLSSNQYAELEKKYDNTVSESALSLITEWNRFLSIVDTHPTVDNPHFEY